MPHALPSALVATNVDFHGDLARNIATIRKSQDLFDDLSPDPRDWAVAIAAEAVGRPAAGAAVIERPFDYGTVITYSFDTASWQETRFSDGRRYGVWYGSLEAETTVFETVYHWHRFLTDSYPDVDREIAAERRIFAVRCEALLIDLRGREKAFPDLVSRRSHAFTHAVGAFVHEQGLNGLLSRSARCDGVNAAIFKRERLSNVRERMLLTYRCDLRADRCRVERTPGRTWLEIRPSTLY
jgi:hypothetical protein